MATTLSSATVSVQIDPISAHPSTNQEMRTSEHAGSDRFSPLFNHVQKLGRQYIENPVELDEQYAQEQTEQRMIAMAEAIKSLMKDHVTQVMTAARFGRQEARCFEWGYADQIQYNGCYLRDLLFKFDLLARIQTFIDQLHGFGRFKVYTTLIGPAKRYPELALRRYGLFISWDPNDFKRINGLLEYQNNLRQRSISSEEVMKVDPPTPSEHININVNGGAASVFAPQTQPYFNPFATQKYNAQPSPFYYNFQNGRGSGRGDRGANRGDRGGMRGNRGGMR